MRVFHLRHDARRQKFEDLLNDILRENKLTDDDVVAILPATNNCWIDEGFWLAYWLVVRQKRRQAAAPDCILADAIAQAEDGIVRGLHPRRKAMR